MTRFLGLRGKGLHYAAMLGVAMPAIMTLGYGQGVLGGLLTLLNFEHQFHEMDVTDAFPSERFHRSTIQGTVVALFSVGGLFGATTCIGLGDKIGRRRTILFASVVQIMGALLMSSAFNFAQLILSRIVLGLGVGGQLTTVVIWQAEISPANKRGAHVGTTGIFVAMGLTLALVVDLGMSFVPNSSSWRLPFAIPILLCLPVITLGYFLPESPRWLVRQSRLTEAREVLAALHDIDAEHERIAKDIKNVQLSLSIAGEGSFGQVVRMGCQRNIHRACLAAGGLILLQLTGINSITYYTTTIFQHNLSLSPVTSRILAAIYQLSGALGGVVCVFIIEAHGRRVLMIASAMANTACMALVAGLSSQSGNGMAMHAAVVFVFLFHFCMSAGFGGVPFLYASEIAPLSQRATINGIGSGLFWAFGVMIAEITPIAFNALGWGYFVIFAALNAVMVPVIYFFFPETAGLSLEEIDTIFTKSTGFLESVHVAKRLTRKDARMQTRASSSSPEMGMTEI